MASGGRRPEHGGPPELVSCVALGRPVAAGSPCLNFSPYSPFLSRSFTTRMKPGNTYASKGVWMLSSVGSRQPASRPDLRHCLESTQNLGGGGGRKGPGFISFVIVAKPPSVKSLSHVGVIYLSVNTGVMLCLSGWFSKLIARTCFKHVVKRAGGSGWA